MTVTDLSSLPVVLTPQEFGEALRWGRTSVYKWVREHPDQVVRYSTLVRIPRRVVEQMLAGNGHPEDGNEATGG